MSRNLSVQRSKTYSMLNDVILWQWIFSRTPPITLCRCITGCLDSLYFNPLYVTFCLTYNTLLSWRLLYRPYQTSFWPIGSVSWILLHLFLSMPPKTVHITNSITWFLYYDHSWKRTVENRRISSTFRLWGWIPLVEWRHQHWKRNGIVHVSNLECF